MIKIINFFKKTVLATPGFIFILCYLSKVISFLFIFKKKKHDLLFIIPNRGWILERICKEVAKKFSSDFYFYNSVKNIEKSNIYFFSHYRLFISSILRNPHIFLDKTYVFYTHYDKKGIHKKDLGKILNLANGVFVMNSDSKKFLLSLGVKKNKIKIVFAGADPNRFKPKQQEVRPVPTIGFCLKYFAYEEYFSRKNYQVVIDLIKNLPEYNFMILGKDWEKYEKFVEISKLTNFRYIETEYENYPKYYNEMDIFISPTKLEGGPVPLLEAMMTGVFPISTKTGFAPDVISDGENGILVETNANINDYKTSIKKALVLKDFVNVRESVIEYTWDSFGKKIVNTFDL